MHQRLGDLKLETWWTTKRGRDFAKRLRGFGVGALVVIVGFGQAKLKAKARLAKRIMSWTNLLVFAFAEQVAAQIHASSATYQTFSQTTWPKRPTLWVSTSTFRPTLVFLYMVFICSRTGSR